MRFLFLSHNPMASLAAAASSSADLPPVLSILWQALLLPSKTALLFLPLLLLSLSSSLLFSATFPSLSPLLADLARKLSPFIHGDPPAPDPSRALSDILVDLLRFSHAQFPALLAAFLSSSVLLAAASYAFAMAYTDTPLSPQSLVKRIVARAYQTLVTKLYVVVLTLGYFSLSFLVLGAVGPRSSGADHNTNLALATSTALPALSAFLYLYLHTRWSVSLVVAVVEETWGIGALSWSVELFIGNKSTGTALTAFLMAVKAAIYALFGVLFVSQPPAPQEQLVRVGTAVAAAGAAWDLYSTATYTVFYYYCRKSHGLDASPAPEGFIYAALPPPVVKVEL